MIEVTLPPHLQHPTLNHYLLDSVLALEVTKICGAYYMSQADASFLPCILGNKNTAMMKAKTIDKRKNSFRLSHTI